jgi:hypothetical protein
MSKTYTYEWAVGNWKDRAKLQYKPTDKDAGGCGDIPAQFTGVRIPDGRIPYKMEDTGEGVRYITYSSAEKAAIIRITEAAQ